MSFKSLWKYMTTDPNKKKTKKNLTGKLTTPLILFILINSILGSSLFYLPGLGVRAAGAASIIAWAALFILAALMMMYIGELITLHPTSGGTFEFCRLAYGRFGAYVAGWSIWLAGNFAMALNIVAAAEYFIPSSVAYHFPIRIIFAIIWIVVLNYMAFRGVDAGATMLVVFGVIATAVVTSMIIPSFLNLTGNPFSLEMMQPFFQHSGTAMFGFLALSLFFIIEAFFGFEVISYLANEAREPRKLHKVLIGGVLICGVIMTLYVFSSLGTVSYHDYTTDARPWAVQALNNLGGIGQQFVVFGMYLTIIGAAAAWPITGSRLIRAMAKHKLFLEGFADLHPKHNSPHKAVYFQTIAVSLFAWFIFRGYIVKWGDPYKTVYLMYVLLGLVVLSLVLLAVPILRKKEAHLKRPFKAPFGRVIPILFVLGFVYLIYNWIKIEGGMATSIIMLSGSLLLVGIPFYFLVEMFYDPKAIVRVNEWLSYFVVVGEKFSFPFSIRKKILKDLGNVKGKVLLEYGCSVGTLTKKLAPKVSGKGRIFATDLSLHKVKIADKRTKLIKHVSVHHHPHLNDFKLKLPKIDRVISIGMLSYMQNPKKILTSLAKRIKKNSEIVFVDYDKFFYFIPNVKWIENDKQLIKVFSQAGFNVKIERKNSLLWQYIIVSGKKR